MKSNVKELFCTKGFNDFLLLSERDIKICHEMERLFPEEFAVSDATYHIQQAVEKQLKAILLYYGQNIEYTHNIAKLADACENCGVQLPASLELVEDTLTTWEATNRYDPYINFSESKYSLAKDAYQGVREITKTIEKELEDISCDDLGNDCR